jgi:hypothetical protein
MTDALFAPSQLLKAIANALQQAEGEEPEIWAKPIEERFIRVGAVTRLDAGSDIHALVHEWQHGARIQAQRDDLRLLVRQHYLSRLTAEQKAAFWSVPRDVQERWREAGVLGPETKGEPLSEIIDSMAEAARLTDLLHSNHTYAQMRRMAVRAPESAVDKLALHVANETLTSAIERLATRHGDIVADTASMQQRKHLLSVVGNVKIDGRGKNIRERLARDMANLLDGKDVRREWERAAITTTRYAYNLGVLARLRDNSTAWIAYDVHPQACTSCKKLLLHNDETPRAFLLASIWQQIAEDGGLNIGRKATLIGKDDGWRVGVVVHPLCRCRPRTAKKLEIARMNHKGT